MSFNWIPDAESDPHPRRTWLVECCFDLTVLALYRREIIWPPDFRLEPGTLIISNHQRDADVPILATALCQREGLRMRRPLPFFAAREDMFHRGFLAEYATGGWRILQPLLGLIPLAWMFHIARCAPMRRVREFTLGETLDALLSTGLGDADPAVVFNVRGRREITAALGKLPPHLRELLSRRLGELRLSRWGVRRLRIAAFRILKPGFQAAIAAHLQHFASVLDAGRSLYFAPEGVISATGEFGRIRAGAGQLCRLTITPPSVLPLALSYDALAPGRLRVIIRVGEPVRDLDYSRQQFFAASLRHAILRLYSVNPSHLIARFLTAGPVEFTTREFTEWLQRALAAVSAAGLMLDPLFTRQTAEALAAERLRWLARKGLIAREGAHWHNRWPRDSAPGLHKPANVVRYLANAFSDLSPELARTLGP